MASFDHPIMQEVVGLELPCPEEVVINRAAALAVRGIVPEFDSQNETIVLTASRRVLDYLQAEQGFTSKRIVVGVSAAGMQKRLATYHSHDNRFSARAWEISMARYNKSPDGKVFLEEQIHMADQDDKTGLHIASLAQTALLLQETGNPSHARQLERIHQYLRNGY